MNKRFLTCAGALGVLVPLGLGLQPVGDGETCAAKRACQDEKSDTCECCKEEPKGSCPAADETGLTVRSAEALEHQLALLAGGLGHALEVEPVEVHLAPLGNGLEERLAHADLTTRALGTVGWLARPADEKEGLKKRLAELERLLDELNAELGGRDQKAQPQGEAHEHEHEHGIHGEHQVKILEKLHATGDGKGLVIGPEGVTELELGEGEGSSLSWATEGDGKRFVIRIGSGKGEGENEWITVLDPSGAQGAIELRELDALKGGVYTLKSKDGAISLESMDDGGFALEVPEIEADVDSFTFATPKAKAKAKQKEERQELKELTQLLSEMRQEMREMRESLREMRKEVEALRGDRLR